MGKSLEIYGRGNEHSGQSKGWNLRGSLASLRGRFRQTVPTLPTEVLGFEPSVTSKNGWRVYCPLRPEAYTLQLRADLMKTVEDSYIFFFDSGQEYSSYTYNTEISVHREAVGELGDRIGLRIYGSVLHWDGRYEEYVSQKFVLPQTGAMSDGLVIFQYPRTGKQHIRHIQPSEYRGKILITPVRLSGGSDGGWTIEEPPGPKGGQEEPLPHTTQQLDSPKLLPAGKKEPADFLRELRHSIPVER